MTYVDLDGWVDAFHREAVRAGDQQRIRLWNLYHNGVKNKYTDPHASLHFYAEGRALAEALDEPCWVLLFASQITGTYLYQIKDLQTAMRLTAETLVEARKPQYAGCPILGCVYYDGADVLIYLDAVGHAARIFELLDYMENHIALDYDTACRVVVARVDMAFELDHLDEAQTLAEQYLAISERSPFRMGSAYCRLSSAAFWRNDLELALAQIDNAIHMARRGNYDGIIPELLVWKTMLLRKLNREDEARGCYRHALNAQSRLAAPPSDRYFDGLAYYLEDGGDAVQALELREQQIGVAEASGRIAYPAEARLRRARLRGRMGLLRAEDTAELHTAAEKLLAPALFLEKVAAVERGDFTERL